MGKKAKIGKARKDKFYHLAKEAGFRSRAAFKLLQLNKRFEFLQQSRALVDLCAAPGGWLQVAEQQMPVSSLRVGVDLVPIKPIKNCIAIQGDITEEKTRHAVRKELNTWEADCVLHDGAPNVGTNWTHDAFQQNCLTLSALRLATQILRRGGYFVTKVFRSADSQALIGVFDKLFKKVHVWKPAASRLESAEIFVVCQHYLKPDKVDPELLDSKKVFADQPSNAEDDKVNLHRLLLHPGRKEKKPKALGYEDDGHLGQHQEVPVSEFLASKNALQLLGRASALVLDSESQLMSSKHTTEEIKECLRDLKVCGPAEMRNILQWRKKLVNEQKKAEKEEEEQKKKEEEKGRGEKTVEEMEEEEESVEMKELEEIDELIRTAKAEEKAKLKKRKRKLLKEKRKLEERKKLNMVHEGDEPTLSEDLELFSLKTVRKLAERARAMQAAKAAKGELIKEEEEEESGIESDESEEEEEGEEEKEVKIVEGKEEKREQKEESGSESEEEEGMKEEEEEDGLDDMEAEEEKETAKRKRKLSPEQLAMGEQMVYSRKRARDLEDWGWNRYTSNDDGLPEWFVSDEKRHCRKELPVDPTRVAYYAQRDRELNVRPIKKVVEAKQRKRKRQQRRMERAKKKAEGIVENEQMEHGEKIRELKKLYRRAGTKEKKKEVAYQVVTKGRKGTMTRPKGPYRLVDRRLKKDVRGLKQKGKRNMKKGGKRESGRKPQQQRTGGAKKRGSRT